MGDTGDDLDVAYSSVPQNPDEQQKGSKMSQMLLWVVLTVVMYGIAAETFFIYHLYHHKSAVSALTLNITSEQDRSICVPPSKVAAHLTAGSATVHEKTVMHWNVSDPLLHGTIYEDGGLIIPKEGHYYVYSKVSFSDSDVFQHSVTLSREKYLNNVTLMQSRKYPSASKESGSNSFLGGIFHLYEHDRIFVTVSNTSKIMQNNSYENFGAFMI